MEHVTVADAIAFVLAIVFVACLVAVRIANRFDHLDDDDRDER